MSITAASSTKGRSWRFAASAIAVATLLASSLAWGSPASAQGGEFLLSSYGTGVEETGNYCWRGWGFELNDDIEVSALTGGGSVVPQGFAFIVAIWEATYDAGTDTITFGNVVAEASFPSVGAEQSATLPAPVTLTAGQVYVMGMGINTPTDDESGMYRVTETNTANIAGPTELMSRWISPSDTEAFSFGIENADEECGGSPSLAVGSSQEVSNNDTSTNPAVGFAYTEIPEPTTTTTTSPAPPAPTTSTTVAPAPAPVTPRFTG